jgi:hypothetical protein
VCPSVDTVGIAYIRGAIGGLGLDAGALLADTAE